MQQFSGEVVEYIYSQTIDDNERRDMVFAFYGQYFILLKQVDERMAGKMSLKDFLVEKPSLKEQILDKIEGIVQKLVEKGMSRHSLVQAIIKDYVVS